MFAPNIRQESDKREQDGDSRGSVGCSPAATAQAFLFTLGFFVCLLWLENFEHTCWFQSKLILSR